MVGHERIGGGGQDTQPAHAKEADAARAAAADGARLPLPRPRCACCGHLADGFACDRCGGTAHDLGDFARELRPGRGSWLLDIGRGLLLVWRSVGQTLHHRAFVGLLKLPIAANLVAAATLAAGAVLVFGPLRALFAAPWPLLDGWRQAQQDRGPVVLLLVTVWLLWPVWFEVVGGALLEPLVAAAERAIGGPRMRAGAAPDALAARVHRRARMLALQVLLLPLAWLLALLPWVGLPLVFAASAAMAAAAWLAVPAERRGLSPPEQHGDLRRNWPLAFGYGAGLQFAVLVPLLNVLLLAPVAAVGASALHFRFDKQTPP